MTRFSLTLAALCTLSLNGSMASASIATNPMPDTPVAAACTPQTPCVISLRMMSAPPARPADLAARYAEQASDTTPALGRR